MVAQLLFDRYRVIEPIGEGCVGSIFLVEDVLNEHKKLALKVLTNDQALDQHTAERFIQEAQVSLEIDNPNLIKVYDTYFIKEAEICDTHFKNRSAFTMEYIDGCDLRARLSQGHIPDDQIDTIFGQILSALSELHKRGISHRDIKLENILLRKNGDAVLTDLGIIKTQGGAIKTKPGTFIGTIQYFPPEYLLKNIYEPRGDIYAAGILLLEVATGEMLNSELRGEKLAQHLIDTDFAISEESLSKVSAKYRYIIRKATRKDIDKRYQTAEEMIADFFKEPAYFVQNPSLQNQEQASPNVFKKLLRSYKSMSPIMRLVTLSLLIGTVVFLAALVLA